MSKRRRNAQLGHVNEGRERRFLAQDIAVARVSAVFRTGILGIDETTVSTSDSAFSRADSCGQAQLLMTSMILSFLEGACADRRYRVICIRDRRGS